MVFQNNILAGVAGQGGDAAFDIEYSCRFNRNTTSRMTRTVSGTATDGSKGIVGCWFKKSGLEVTQTLFGATGQAFLIDFNATDQIMIGENGEENVLKS